LSTIVTSYVTISCDAEGCGKTATFNQTQEAEAEAIKANPWLTTVRFVTTMDKRKLNYCSDACEVSASGKGQHNPLEPKKIVAGNERDVNLAAQAAAAAAKAEAAMKAGTGIQVVQS